MHSLLAAIHTENMCVLLLGTSPIEMLAHVCDRSVADVPRGAVILLSMALRLFN